MLTKHGRFPENLLFIFHDVVTDIKRVDFKNIIAEIEAAGISHYKIACMMHRQFGQVARWKNGIEPKHYEGQMLLMIHAEYVTK